MLKKPAPPAKRMYSPSTRKNTTGFCSCKTRIHHIHVNKCPVDLRGKVIHVRYDRMRRSRFIVYFNEQRMGEGLLLDLHYHANRRNPARAVE